MEQICGTPTKKVDPFGRRTTNLSFSAFYGLVSNAAKDEHSIILVECAVLGAYIQTNFPDI